MITLRGYVGVMVLFASTLATAVPQVTPEQERAAAIRNLGMAQSQLYERALTRLDIRLKDAPTDYEASLLKGLLLFKSGEGIRAVEELRGLTRRAPRFHLAHLVLGDLLLAGTQGISDFGGSALLASEPVEQQEIERLRQEAGARLKAFLDTIPQGRLPRALLLLGGEIEQAIVVDKRAHRLYLFGRGDDGSPELQRDYYVSTGKLQGNKLLRGDLKTPEGVYFITRHIPEAELPDKYGVGAFPMNYPNELDQKLGKTGYGIWLHGTDFTYYSRPPLDSEGCVVLPNLDLRQVEGRLKPGTTPVIVTDQVDWLETSAWLSQQRELRMAIESWRQDWASGDVEGYLGHYADGFWSKGHDRASWGKRKRQVAAGKRFQEVELDELSLFGYPRAASDGWDAMVVANFRQRYDSNNYRSTMRKRLYLVRESGHWRVLYEGEQ